MTIVQTTTDTETSQAQQLAEGLLRLAAFVEANPELAADLKYSFNNINVPHVASRGDAKQYLAKFARAGVRAGAKLKKSFDDKWGNIELAFGPVVLHVYADRDEVCERVVTGTREVTEQVPDPEALAAVPLVAVTRTVEDVEWVCPPSLLAPSPAEVAEAVLAS